jgi:methylated-DNA-[protein]-cysteine S-methyltransferase
MNTSIRLAHRIPSPLGELLAVADEDGALTRLDFLDEEAQLSGAELAFERAPFKALERMLARYFDGTREEFDLELAPSGTPFQKRVWGTLRRIPYGKTWSYGELARALGNPNASRAVGRANGTNPIAIVVPCHRVIGADGTLTGYGGGIERKRRLLELEGWRSLC